MRVSHNQDWALFACLIINYQTIGARPRRYTEQAVKYRFPDTRRTQHCFPRPVLRDEIFDRESLAPDVMLGKVISIFE